MHRPRHMRQPDRTDRIMATAAAMVGVGITTLAIVAGIVAGTTWVDTVEADMTSEVQRP